MSGLNLKKRRTSEKNIELDDFVVFGILATVMIGFGAMAIGSAFADPQSPSVSHYGTIERVSHQGETFSLEDDANKTYWCGQLRDDTCPLLREGDRVKFMYDKEDHSVDEDTLEIVK